MDSVSPRWLTALSRLCLADLARLRLEPPSLHGLAVMGCCRHLSPL